MGGRVNPCARPGTAIAFGAFFICAETCLHADSVLSVASRPLELPVYDWTAGGFLLVAGVLSQADLMKASRSVFTGDRRFHRSLAVIDDVHWQPLLR
jgi:hypothetical protein